MSSTGSNYARPASVGNVFAPYRLSALPLWKRLLDLTLLVLLFPFLLLPVLLAASFIKLVSRGPVVFKQSRIGYLGRPFTCWKFRTMHPQAGQDVHRRYTRALMQSDLPMKKLDGDGDTRLIRCGRLLRASGVDEIPQLLNVLLGDMSLVGPRPCMPYEWECYLPWQKRRFETLPGLTGLWQVSGKNRTTFNQMVALDIEYVERRSLWLDLSIIARTVPVLFSEIKDVCLSRLRTLNCRTNSTQINP